MASLAGRLLAPGLTFIFGLVIGSLYVPVDRFLEHHFAQLRGFVAGHPLETETGVVEKIQNDLGIAPWRAMRDAVIAENFAYAPVVPAAGLDGAFPESRIEMYLDPAAPALSGYAGLLLRTRVDTGRGYSPALVLAGFDARVHKVIPLDAATPCECSATRALNYFHIASDPGDAGQGGNHLVNVDSCGQVAWKTASRYRFHHYLNSDGEHGRSALWILDATDLVSLDTANGRELNRIGLGEIINANPELPIFEARLKGTRTERWRYGSAEFVPLGRTHSRVSNADEDPFHTNDIDEFDGGGPGLFARGDLALSFRSLNLLAVVRPSTLEIVWYAAGLTSRQHDPDFVSANAIMVYDNNFHNDFSRVVRLRGVRDAGGAAVYGASREVLVEQIGATRFWQPVDGQQFTVARGRGLVLSANHYTAGVDLEDGSVFVAVRHAWREQAFLSLDVERMLTRAEFDDIRAARCR